MSGMLSTVHTHVVTLGVHLMPTRRILELMVVVAIAVRPAFGLAKLWATKAFATSQPGSVTHGTAEIVSVIV